MSRVRNSNVINSPHLASGGSINSLNCDCPKAQGRALAQKLIFHQQPAPKPVVSEVRTMSPSLRRQPPPQGSLAEGQAIQHVAHGLGDARGVARLDRTLEGAGIARERD